MIEDDGKEKGCVLMHPVSDYVFLLRAYKKHEPNYRRGREKI